MKMKRFILIIVLCFVYYGLEAQEKESYNGLVLVKEKEIKIEGEDVVIDMEITISGIPVGRMQSLTLSPVIYNVKDSLLLPSVVLNGSNKSKMHKRQFVLNKNEKVDPSVFIILKNTPTVLQVISYKQTIPYQSWMEDAGLALSGIFRNFKDEPVRIYRDVLVENLELKK